MLRTMATQQKMIKPLSMLMFAAEYESANTPTNTLSSRRLPIIMKETKYSAIAAGQSDTMINLTECEGNKNYRGWCH